MIYHRILVIPAALATTLFFLAFAYWAGTYIWSVASARVHPFLGRPTFGGKLTILNCMFWAVVILDRYFQLRIVHSIPAICLLPILFAMTCPVAWPCLLAGEGGDTEKVVFSILIGINSIAWGYGISWLTSIRERRRRRQGLCPACGYYLRDTPDRCPGCGTVTTAKSEPI